MYYIYIIYLGQFKAILNHFGVILGPFVDLWTHLGLSWAVFGAILSHFGFILGPFLNPFGANFQVGQADLKLEGPIA